MVFGNIIARIGMAHHTCGRIIPEKLAQFVSRHCSAVGNKRNA